MKPRTSICSLAAACVLLALGCTESNGPDNGNPDGPLTDMRRHEASIMPDGRLTDGPGTITDGPGTVADGPGTIADGPGTIADGTQELNCSEIGLCADTCADGCPGGLGQIACMIKCANDCKAQGCATAQTAFTALYNCINQLCWSSCMFGNTPQCANCVTTQCASQTVACDAQDC